MIRARVTWMTPREHDKMECNAIYQREGKGELDLSLNHEEIMSLVLDMVNLSF